MANKKGPKENGPLSSLAKDYLAAPPIEHQSNIDAAAVQAIRDQLEKLHPRQSKSPISWRLPQIISILKVLEDFLQKTMSEPATTDQGEIEVFCLHPTGAILSEFILTLGDLEKGILAEQLKGQTNTSGNSKKVLEEENIRFGLCLVTVLMSDGMPAGKARQRAAKALRASGIRVGDKDMTEKRLREWAKNRL
jgi:hypothetical protein